MAAKLTYKTHWPGGKKGSEIYRHMHQNNNLLMCKNNILNNTWVAIKNKF